MSNVEFGKFYREAPGQLQENEEIFLCAETYEEAERDCIGIYSNLHPEVRLLKTIDSDIPFRNSAGQPTPNHEATRFPSQRYCVVITIPTTESE